jgi:hypothetical protein
MSVYILYICQDLCHWLNYAMLILCIYVFLSICVSYCAGVKLSSILTELDITHIDIWVLVSE